MAVFNTKLVRKEQVADGTTLFHFEKPPDFDYVAGQYAYYILPGGQGNEDRAKIHHFTIAFAPFENELGFATRMRNSPYKNSMKNLPIGSAVKFDGAEGNFTLKEPEKTIVFLTGGIGVTTARSIITEALYDGVDKEILLFSSNNTPDLAPFNQYFYDLEKKYTNFAYIPIFTDTSGHLNIEMIQKYIPDLNSAIYYVSGTSGFVDAMDNLLSSNKVKNSNVVKEKFPGY